MIKDQVIATISRRRSGRFALIPSIHGRVTVLQSSEETVVSIKFKDKEHRDRLRRISGQTLIPFETGVLQETRSALSSPCFWRDHHVNEIQRLGV